MILLFHLLKALEELRTYQEQVINLKSQETKLRRGLNIFKIEQPPSKDLQGIEKDLEYLEQVWSVTKEWEELWDAWKVGKFEELVTTDMETTSQLLFKRLNKLVREVKVLNYIRSLLKLVHWFSSSQIGHKAKRMRITFKLARTLYEPGKVFA